MHLDILGVERLEGAVARLLKRNNLSLQDFDYYEIHEAFAGQVLCTLKAWESDDYCKRTYDCPVNQRDKKRADLTEAKVGRPPPGSPDRE